MYLVLNKENDYKANRSKIVAMETAYKSVNKLISLNEGDLTEEMLLNIKEKQDLTYQGLVDFYNDMNSFFPQNTIDKTIEYQTLDPEKIKAYENLSPGQDPNFVDMNLLTNIMKNEKSFLDKINIMKSQIWPFNVQVAEYKAKSVSGWTYQGKVAHHQISSHVATYSSWTSPSGTNYHVIIRNYLTGGKYIVNLGSSYLDLTLTWVGNVLQIRSPSTPNLNINVDISLWQFNVLPVINLKEQLLTLQDVLNINYNMPT